MGQKAGWRGNEQTEGPLQRERGRGKERQTYEKEVRKLAVARF